MRFLLRFAARLFMLQLGVVILTLLVGAALPYPALVYIAKDREGDQLRLYDLNLRHSVGGIEAESLGVLDISNDNELLVTTADSVGSILNIAPFVERRLQPEVYGIDNNPIWSPDGQRIAYRRYYFQAGLYVYTLGRWPPRPLDISASAIAWSPDSQSLAFSRWNMESNQEEVRLVDIHSREQTLLAGWRKPVKYMRWSPAGDEIVLTTISNELHFLDLDTLSFLPNPSTLETVYSPQWSPDGSALAFISTERDEWGRRTAQLVLMRRDGTILSRRTLDGLTVTSHFDWWQG